DITRKYTMPNSSLHTLGQTMIDNLRLQLPDFTPRFAWIDTAYVDAFQAKLDVMLAIPLDMGMVDDIKVITGDIKTKLQTGNFALRQLNRYAKSAFAKDDVRRNVQGKDSWKNVQHDAPLMFRALQQAFDYAKEDPIKAALIAKGYTQADIDELETIANAINALINTLDTAKKQRQITTQQRIVGNNEFYEIMQTVSNCAKAVWMQDAARLKQYNLMPVRTKLPTIILATVTNATTGKPLKDAIITIEELPKLAPKTTTKKGIGKVSSHKMGATVNIKVVCVGFEVTIIEVKVKKGKENKVEVQMINTN
ncbi:MAG: hypothetical protein NTX03_05095, partial [Bacteroidetes bacterium]|nr:hypothetical protein [Bacteroidota bacterium]